MEPLLKGKYFAVELLSNLINFDGTKGCFNKEILPLSAGLSISRLMPDGVHTCVVAYVKPHTWQYAGITVVDYSCYACTEELSYGVVSLIDEKMPMVDFWEMMQEYKNCVLFAKGAVEDALANEAKLNEESLKG